MTKLTAKEVTIWRLRHRPQLRYYHPPRHLHPSRHHHQFQLLQPLGDWGLYDNEVQVDAGNRTRIGTAAVDVTDQGGLVSKDAVNSIICSDQNIK